MGTATIDVIQSAQITTLQNDVAELTTKLNAVVADIATLKDKIGTATYGNTTGGGANTDSILKRLHDLDTDFVNLSVFLDNHQGHVYNHSQYGHSGSAGQAGRGSGGAALTQSIDINGATSTSTNATTTGVYTPESQQVVVLTNDGAARAREVARSTLTKLRDI